METVSIDTGTDADAPFRKRFQHAVNPHAPALVLDAEGTIQFMTRGARHLLEYQTDQQIENSFFSHVHGKNLYQVMRDVADMVCHGKRRAAWLVRLRTGKGRWRWYKAQAHNQLDQTTGAIAISLNELHG